MDPAIIVALIGGAFGLVSMAYTARQSRQASRDRADQDARLSRLAAEDGAYQRSAAFDQATQQRMQAEIDRQAEQIRVLQRRVTRLTRQLIAAGLVPDDDREVQG
ncbi:hypothetical protein [Spongiactinospora sp. TRM90649]|uniref:hypothetical protein n=1 Tax=Spongiactinospora sp. TRM90649 TaxID=3031114 RepID=UPI0023F85855|nr:hypothetical protein [Spongiactinospora sp. TRM90649]MDF5755830.1 hypothetical protein [Spongiactinospora sp. TRM90649]